MGSLYGTKIGNIDVGGECPPMKCAVSAPPWKCVLLNMINADTKEFGGEPLGLVQTQTHNSVFMVNVRDISKQSPIIHPIGNRSPSSRQPVLEQFLVIAFYPRSVAPQSSTN